MNVFTTRSSSPFFAPNYAPKECIYFLSRSFCFHIWLRLKVTWLQMQIYYSQHGPPNYKFFLPAGNLHEMPLHLCSETWILLCAQGSCSESTWLFSGRATRSKCNLAFGKVFTLAGHLQRLFSKIQFLLLQCRQESLRRLETPWRSRKPSVANGLWKVPAKFLILHICCHEVAIWLRVNLSLAGLDKEKKKDAST